MAEGMSSEQWHQQIGKISFSTKDNFGEQGRFGSVFKGKFDGKIQVAVKRVNKMVTKVEESKFYFKVNGHPNVVNYFCIEDSDFVFT